jgi:hypothetical protein
VLLCRVSLSRRSDTSGGERLDERSQFLARKVPLALGFVVALNASAWVVSPHAPSDGESEHFVEHSDGAVGRIRPARLGYLAVKAVDIREDDVRDLGVRAEMWTDVLRQYQLVGLNSPRSLSWHILLREAVAEVRYSRGLALVLDVG